MIERGDGVVGYGGVWGCVREFVRKNLFLLFLVIRMWVARLLPIVDFSCHRSEIILTRIITRVTMTNMITMMTIMLTYLLVVLIRKWVSSPTM